MNKSICRLHEKVKHQSTDASRNNASS